MFLNLADRRWFFLHLGSFLAPSLFPLQTGLISNVFTLFFFFLRHLTPSIMIAILLILVEFPFLIAGLSRCASLSMCTCFCTLFFQCLRIEPSMCLFELIVSITKSPLLKELVSLANKT